MMSVGLAAALLFRDDDLVLTLKDASAICLPGVGKVLATLFELLVVGIFVM